MSEVREVDLKIVGGTVVTPTGTRRAGIAIDGGRIVAIGDETLLPPARATHDATGLHVIPGLVDTEAHPGCYVPLQDDVATESVAAVVAGVTTWGVHAPVTRMGAPRFVEYVQKEDVVSFHTVIDDFTGVIERDSAVDVFATYMLETDQQAREIPEYARDHGVTSYKLYLQAMSPEAEPNWPGAAPASAPASTTASSTRRWRRSPRSATPASSRCTARTGRSRESSTSA